jgi:hypothetical protein
MADRLPVGTEGYELLEQRRIVVVYITIDVLELLQMVLKIIAITDLINGLHGTCVRYCNYLL